jgi:hypothetical protein
MMGYCTHQWRFACYFMRYISDSNPMFQNPSGIKGEACIGVWIRHHDAHISSLLTPHHHH